MFFHENFPVPRCSWRPEAQEFVRHVEEGCPEARSTKTTVTHNHRSAREEISQAIRNIRGKTMQNPTKMCIEYPLIRRLLLAFRISPR